MKKSLYIILVNTCLLLLLCLTPLRVTHASILSDILNSPSKLERYFNEIYQLKNNLTGAVVGSVTPLNSTSLTSTSQSLKTTGTSVSVVFSSTLLKYRRTNSQVKLLQIVLNADPATLVAKSGAGSPGHETTYFGPATLAAVKKFQKKYASEVLIPAGVIQPTGFVGTFTINKLNKLVASLNTSRALGTLSTNTQTGTTTPLTNATTPNVIATLTSTGGSVYSYTPPANQVPVVVTPPNNGITGGNPPAVPPTVPAPTLTFTAANTSLTSGQSTTLTWSSTNADSCTASGGWSGTQAVSGSQTTGALTSTRSYVLTCTGGGGTISQNISVNIASVVQPSPSSSPAPVNNPPAPVPNTFVKTDTTTNGTWKGVYGSDGYEIEGGATSLPSYAQVSLINSLPFVWAYSTTDLRDLQQSSGTSRIASSWYSPTSETVDINITDGHIHQVAFYLLDWDGGRSESITITDQNGTVLVPAQQFITPAFYTNGIYVVYNLTGHVQAKIANIIFPNSVTNVVLSGIFFDPIPAFNNNNNNNNPPPPVQPTLTFGASPSSITSGQSATLTWSSTNATSCTASGGWSGTLATAGTQTVSPTATTTYSLACTGASGSVSSAVTVNFTSNSQTTPIASNPYITAPTQPPFIVNSHPDPTHTGGQVFFPSNDFTRLVTITTDRPGNIFYQGEPINLLLNVSSFNAADNVATAYEVRDYYGTLVDSGILNKTDRNLILSSKNPGWYKVYLYNSSKTTSTYGDVVGDGTFTVIRNDSRFPQIPDFFVDGLVFHKQFTRVDANLNFNWQTAGSNPLDSQNLTAPFSVVWTGQLMVPATDTYTFSFNGGTQESVRPDTIRLYVNGKLLINQTNGYNDTSPGTVSLALQAGQRYSIQIEYAHTTNATPFFQTFNWSTASQPLQPVPKTALYSSSQSSIANGLNATYFAYEYNKGNVVDTEYNDELVRSIAQLGPVRYGVEDISTPAAVTASFAQIDPQINFDKQFYLPTDPSRPKNLLIAFVNGTAGQDANLATFVQHYKGDGISYSDYNEPDLTSTYSSGASFAPVECAFYRIVKANDPTAKVIGPSTVQIDPVTGVGLPWIKQFLAAGGNNCIDAISFHAYNTVNGDFIMGRKEMDGLQAVLSQYNNGSGINLGQVSKWQTEQGTRVSSIGLYTPRNQGRWTMMQRMVFDEYNLPKEDDVLWYDIWHNPQYPGEWETLDGSLHPAVPVLMTYSQEMYDTTYDSKYDFGAGRNNIYIGNLYKSSSKNVAMFMTNGATDGYLQLSVPGASSVHVVDAFGNASDIPATNNIATIAVTELPVYVEFSPNQTLSVVQENWGTNLATASGVVAKTSDTNTATLDKIHNGILENNFDGSTSVWSATNPGSNWVELDLPQATQVSRVVIHTPTPFQVFTGILDYTLQYDNNGTWVTLDHVTENPKTFGEYSNNTNSTADTFYSGRSIFVEHFQPVTTSKIRITANAITFGGAPNALAASATNQKGYNALMLQEVEIYPQ